MSVSVAAATTATSESVETLGYPLYTGDSTFQTHLKQFIWFPVKYNPIFDHCFLTVHHMFAVFGREGTRKAEVVRDFCTANSIASTLATVTFGKTRTFCEELESLFYRRRGHAGAPLEVVIVDRADILAFEPDEEFVVRFCLQLEEKAKLANLLLVCCFDRLKGDEAPNPTRTAFFRQFPYETVLTSPTDAAFRAVFYKHIVHAFCKQYAYECQLTDKDFLTMAGKSKWATIDNMLDYCTSVFNRFVFNIVSTPNLQDLTPPLTAAPFLDAVNFCGKPERLRTVPPNAQMLENKFTTTVLGVMSAEPVEKPEKPEKKKQKIQLEEEKEPHPQAPQGPADGAAYDITGEIGLAGPVGEIGNAGPEGAGVVSAGDW